MLLISNIILCLNDYRDEADAILIPCMQMFIRTKRRQIVFKYVSRTPATPNDLIVVQRVAKCLRIRRRLMKTMCVLQHALRTMMLTDTFMHIHVHVETYETCS